MNRSPPPSPLLISSRLVSSGSCPFKLNEIKNRMVATPLCRCYWLCRYRSAECSVEQPAKRRAVTVFCFPCRRQSQRREKTCTHLFSLLLFFFFFSRPRLIGLLIIIWPKNATLDARRVPSLPFSHLISSPSSMGGAWRRLKNPHAHAPFPPF